MLVESRWWGAWMLRRKRRKYFPSELHELKVALLGPESSPPINSKICRITSREGKALDLGLLFQFYHL
jgi:hypothetical protein